jgi:hypothetical protein
VLYQLSYLALALRCLARSEVIGAEGKDQLSYLARTTLFIAHSEVTGAEGKGELSYLALALRCLTRYATNAARPYNRKPALSGAGRCDSKRTIPIACASHPSRGASPGESRTQHAAEITLRKLSIAHVRSPKTKKPGSSRECAIAGAGFEPAASGL